jgi:ABC-type Fe3+-hydroxamate transport system, periplasmic component
MKTRTIVLLWVLSLLLVGCHTGELEKKGNAIISVTDSVNNDVALSKIPDTVVVLSTSWADIWQLAGGKIDGITRDALTEGNLELEEDVIDIGTVREPNLEIILSLEPDFVILSQDISSHAEIATSLNEIGIPFYTTKVDTFEDYLKVLKDFCEITGNEVNYHTYGVQVEKEIQDLLSTLPVVEEGSQKTAIFLRAFSTGARAIADEHVVCDILEQIGVKNIAKTEGFPLDDISLEIILEQDPDYIFITTMGDEEKAIASLNNSLTSDPAWSTLSAIQENQMVFLAKDLYHYKPNARWAEAYETLLKIVYPEIYN